MIYSQDNLKDIEIRNAKAKEMRSDTKWGITTFAGTVLFSLLFELLSYLLYATDLTKEEFQDKVTISWRE